MANFKQEEGMLDFSQYLNMDQISSVTGAQAQNGKTIVAPQFTAPGPEAAFIQPQHMSQQFQGPSHNYDLFRQHSSLPPGAMQSAMQRPRQMMQSMSAMSSSSLYDISEAENNFGNMELDLNDFLAGNSSLEGYVDPNTIGSDVGDVSPVVAPVQRLYPGMHQQQAAKAQQEQQRRLQEQQKSQAQAQRQQQQPPQQPGHQKRASQGRNKHSDPVVEERITQILKQMRASTQGSQRHTSAAPQSSASHAAKIRKEEEDMDDDERLLASEEGKKLSSKERRQLRNKVSARAFRSRRKEYISQLEGEINAKNSENDDLRHDNDMLRTENSQLTDLARMLLGHPAFNTVLEDLSSRGAQMPFLNTQAVQQPQQSQQHRASVAMSQASTQGSNTQSASSGMDFANTPINGWNGGVDAAEFNFNPTVFAVTELPEHPAIDPEVLAGKSTESIIPALPALSPLPSFDEKETAPVLEHAPVFTPAKMDFPTINRPENNHDDLYAERTPVTISPSAEPEYQIFGSVPFEKATSCIVLIDVEDVKKSEAAVNEHFASLFSRLDDLSSRISMVTGDL